MNNMNNMEMDNMDNIMLYFRGIYLLPNESAEDGNWMFVGYPNQDTILVYREILSRKSQTIFLW